MAGIPRAAAITDLELLQLQPPSPVPLPLNPPRPKRPHRPSHDQDSPCLTTSSETQKTSAFLKDIGTSALLPPPPPPPVNLPPKSITENPADIIHGSLHGHLDLPTDRVVLGVVKKEDGGLEEGLLFDEEGKIWEKVRLVKKEEGTKVGLVVEGQERGVGFDGSMLRGWREVVTLLSLLDDGSVPEMVGFVARDNGGEIVRKETDNVLPCVYVLVRTSQANRSRVVDFTTLLPSFQVHGLPFFPIPFDSVGCTMFNHPCGLRIRR